MTVAASVISSVPMTAWIAPPPESVTLRIDSLKNATSKRAAPRVIVVNSRLMSGSRAMPNAVQTSAVTTAILFTLGKFLIGYYLGTSNVASSYGAAASIITILLWIYYSSLILLFGAEFTKAYAESRGSLGSGHTTGPQQETSREIPVRSP